MYDEEAVKILRQLSFLRTAASWPKLDTKKSHSGINASFLELRGQLLARAVELSIIL